MKILIVSYSFPPENIIGAVRVGKLAKYLHERGHEIRVLTAPPGSDRSLPLEIPADRIVYADDRNIDARFDPLIALFRRVCGATPGVAPGGAGIAESSSGSRDGPGLSEFLRRHYYAVLRIPDSRAGWHANAVSAGRGLLAKWRPDLIFASSPPTTSLFVAAALGPRFEVPWVAELRDLWTDNPYYAFPAWRRALDGVLERRLLRAAALLVTVTPPWGQTLQSSYDKPVSVVLNGFAEEDVIGAGGREAYQAGSLSIVYTGNIYRGFRDPSALFVAISKLSPENRASIAVEFYGTSVAEVRHLVLLHGVGDCVGIRPSVTYRESLRLQRNADVLLLLQWDDPRDAGNIPAKFFEYIAAERPMLMLGYGGGILAQMIRERKAGLVSNEPDVIAGQLSAWIDMRRNGGVPGLDPGAKLGLSRREQFQKLETVLERVVPSAPKTS
jgi:glycosyltransferase involved in cell wall biosynthesis